MRYDGYEFKHFKHQVGTNNSLAGDYIFSVFIDTQNRIWAGTASNGVSLYHQHQNRFHHFQHDTNNGNSITSGSVFAIEQTDNNTFWIGTSEGLNQVTLEEDKILRFSEQGETNSRLLNKRIRSLLPVGKNELYVGSAGGLQVLSLKKQAFLPLTAGLEALKGKEIRKLKQDRFGNIWIGTREAGVFRYEPQSDVLAKIEGTDEFESLNKAWIYDILLDNNGNVWLATIGQGIFLIAEDTLQPVQNLRSEPAIPNSLHLNNISALLQDNSGLLWIGTWGEGLQRLNTQNNTFVNIKHQPDNPRSPSNNTAVAIKELENGLIALGTDGNGIELMDKSLGVVSRINSGEEQWQEMEDDYITAIIEPQPNVIWAGTLQNGIYVIDLDSKKILTNYSKETGLPSNRVRTLHINRNGEIWIGGAKGVVLWNKDKNSFNPVKTKDGKIYEQITPNIMTDHLDRVWIGSFNGLFVRLPGSELLFRVGHQPTDEFGLLSQNIKGLFQDSERRIWVDTDQGLNQMQSWVGDRVIFTDISRQANRPGLYFGANMLQDQQGRIWSQWHVLDKALTNITELKASDGIDVGSVTIGAYEHLSDGRFLFGGTNGLLVVAPETFEVWNYTPQLAMTSLSINGREQALLAPGAPLVLSPEQKRFSIGFSALDFSSPKSNQYRYRLQRFDEQWNTTDASIRQASYSNLWPGEYTLQIRGSNRNGLISLNHLDVNVRVLPAYWQTWYFAAGIFVLLSSCIWLFIQLHTKRLNQLARELEEKVQEKTADLAQLNQALQSSNEKLSDKNTELEKTSANLQTANHHLEEAKDKLIMQEKMASLGLLTSGVAHELNTPLGIAVTAASSLKESTKIFTAKMDKGQIKKKDLVKFTQTAEMSSTLALNNLNRAGRLVSLFKQISVDRTAHSQKVLVNLHSLVDEVFAEYKSTALQRHISLHNTVEEQLKIFTTSGVLEEVFEGLISNAFIHAFEGQEAGEITVSSVQLPDTVEITLKDTGKGMSPEQIANAFEPFYTSKRGTECTGLGLHIIYNLITGALKGEIVLRSAPEAGSEFTITIPHQL